MIHLTTHGKRRLRRRLHLSGGLAAKHMDLVSSDGLYLSEARGKVLDYMLRTMDGSKAKDTIIYNRHIYLIADEALITMYSIPGSLIPYLDV